MAKYVDVMENKVDSSIIEESFEFGAKMLGKYADFGTLMSLNADEYADMYRLYALATSFKEEAIKSIKQQNQQSEMIYDLTEIVKEFRNEVSFLRQEIDSLKSKAKKND